MNKIEQRPDIHRLHVFFDGGCPSCAREIAHYRRVAPGETIHWVNADADDTTLARFGVGRNAAMRQLHAIDEAGNWHIGVPAFLAIWQRIPRYRWAAVLVRALRLTGPMQRLYARWAERRFTRLCRAGRCSTGENASA